MILHISVISRTIARTMVLSDNGGGGNSLHPCRRAAGLCPAVGQAAHMSEFHEFMARSWHGHAAGLRHHGGCQHPPRADATRSSRRGRGNVPAYSASCAGRSGDRGARRRRSGRSRRVAAGCARPCARQATALASRPSSRSMSRPTSARSTVRAGAGPAPARRPPWKCRRPRCRACSPTRPTGPACGRGYCSSAMSACGR